MVTGRCSGRLVTFQYVRRRGIEWMRAELLLAEVPLALEAKTQSVTRHRTTPRDPKFVLETGDRGFDSSFHVEAAPADVATLLLSPDVRETMIRQMPLELCFKGAGEETTRIVVLTKSWRPTPQAIAAVVQLASALADRVPAAFHEADRQTEPTGAPYRGERDMLQVRAARRRELDEFRQVRSGACASSGSST